MSVLSDAMQHTLDARARVTGGDEFVTIGGTEYRALVETISIELVMIAGGRADAGGFRCQVAVEDMPKRPDPLTPIVVRDQNLKIGTIDDVNAVAYIFIAVDPVAEGG